MVFPIFTDMYKQNDFRTLSSPQKETQATTNLLSVFVNLPIRDIPCKQNDTCVAFVTGFSRLAKCFQGLSLL